MLATYEDKGHSAARGHVSKGKGSLRRQMATSEVPNGSKGWPSDKDIRTRGEAEKVEDTGGLVESSDAAENIAPGEVSINDMKINNHNKKTIGII